MLPTKFRFIWLLGFRGKDFWRNPPIRNKNCLWWPSLLTDWDEMSNFYTGPSINASYQVSVHLAKRFREMIFRNRPTRNKNLITDLDEMGNLYRGPSIDASFQVSVHLAKQFQKRRLKCEKLTDEDETPSDGKSLHCL